MKDFEASLYGFCPGDNDDAPAEPKSERCTEWERGKPCGHSLPCPVIHGLWTAQDRRNVREAEFRKFPKGHMQAHLAVADRTVAALIEALRAEHGIAIASLGNRHASIHCRTCALLDSLK